MFCRAPETDAASVALDDVVDVLAVNTTNYSLFNILQSSSACFWPGDDLAVISLVVMSSKSILEAFPVAMVQVLVEDTETCRIIAERSSLTLFREVTADVLDS